MFAGYFIQIESTTCGLLCLAFANWHNAFEVHPWCNTSCYLVLFDCWIIFQVAVIVQLLSHVRLFVTPWTAACQASLSFTTSQSLLKLMSAESVMPSNHLIICYPLLLPPSIFPSIRVFSSESALRIRWQKYWSFSFSIIPSSEYSGLISFRIDWFDLWEFSHRSPQIPCRSFGPVQNIHKTFGLHQKMSANPQSTQE